MIRQIILNNTVIDKFPSIHIFALPVQGLQKVTRELDVSTINFEILSTVELDNITNIPEIIAWRNTFKNMNVKPSKYHSSIESLLRRVRKNPQACKTGIPIVDFYNFYSIKHRSTLGGYDIHKLPDNVPLEIRTLNTSKDFFNPIGAEPSKFNLALEQISYTIGNEIACWCLNHRDSKNFSLDNTTDKALFCSESISNEQKEASINSLRDLASAIKHNGGEIENLIILNKDALREEVYWS